MPAGVADDARSPDVVIGPSMGMSLDAGTTKRG